MLVTGLSKSDEQALALIVKSLGESGAADAAEIYRRQIDIAERIAIGVIGGGSNTGWWASKLKSMVAYLARLTARRDREKILRLVHRGISIGMIEAKRPDQFSATQRGVEWSRSICGPS